MKAEKKEAVDGRKRLLRKLILTKLRSVHKEKFGPKAIDKFSLVFKVFLLRYLNLNYEFTLDELLNELNKIKLSAKLKDRIIKLSTLLVEIEYEDKQISGDEFKSLLDEAEGIINLATGQAEKEGGSEEKIEEEKAQVKKRPLFDFLHKIGLVKTEEEKKAIRKIKEEAEKEKERLRLEKEKEMLRIDAQKEKEKKKLEEEKKIQEEKEKRKRPIILPPPAPFPDIEAIGLENGEEKKKVKPLELIPEVEEKRDNVKSIKEKIHKARIMVKKSKLNDAKKTYIEIIKIYLLLDPKEQAEVYMDITKLYSERKRREKLRRVR